MKDILSLLQSRIDKRANILNHYSDSDWIIAEFVDLQKQDKKLFAEIVNLRRKVSRNCEED